MLPCRLGCIARGLDCDHGPGVCSLTYQMFHDWPYGPGLCGVLSSAACAQAKPSHNTMWHLSPGLQTCSSPAQVRRGQRHIPHGGVLRQVTSSLPGRRCTL